MLYFAYGSNMDEKLLQQHGIHFLSRKKAVLHGYTLVFNKQSSKNPDEGKANIIENPDGTVEGILYDVDAHDVKKLDVKEGYPRHYQHASVQITLEDDRTMSTMTYFANPETVGEGLKPTKNHMQHILAGEFYLSRNYVSFLKLIETLD